MTLPTMPTLIVEVGFTVGAFTGIYLHLGDPLRGLLDTGTLAPDDILVDVTPWVRGVSIQRGSTRVEGPIIRYEAGTSTTDLKDLERRFDPTNLSGPYVTGGVTQVKPMRVVRHRASWAGVGYELWRGFADAWQISYEGPRAAFVTLTGTDAFKVLGNHSRVAVAGVGAGEGSGARVGRVLDSVSWSDDDREIAAGDTTLMATTLDGDALSELQLVADTEIGELYMSGAGRVVFRNRQAILTETRSTTSQATFGDGAGEIGYISVEPEYDETQLANTWLIAREGGTTQIATDTASMNEYLTHTYERSDLLMQTDQVAADYAAYGVFLAAQPELRFASMTLHPQRDPTNLYPQVLGREIGDRITIKRRPPGGGTITRDVFIRGIRHEVTTETWTTTWTLQSATLYSFLVLDHATLGQLGSNALSY